MISAHVGGTEVRKSVLPRDVGTNLGRKPLLRRLERSPRSTHRGLNGVGKTWNFPSIKWEQHENGGQYLSLGAHLGICAQADVQTHTEIEKRSCS